MIYERVLAIFVILEVYVCFRVQAYEVDKKARFERAAKEREATALQRQEADKKLQEAKAKAAATNKRTVEVEETEPTDDLMGFFSEVGVGVAAVPKAKPEKTLTDEYAKADLGKAHAKK
jgi:hypothetical protein